MSRKEISWQLAFEVADSLESTGTPPDDLTDRCRSAVVDLLAADLEAEVLRRAHGELARRRTTKGVPA